MNNQYTLNIKYFKGDKEYYVNGKLHRNNGPAIEYADGSKRWYLNNQLHRIDGPAVEHADGDKAWYMFYYRISEINNILSIYNIYRVKVR